MKSGNRCGHNPHAPRLDSTRVIKKKLPSILMKAAEKWKKLYSNPDLEGFRHLTKRHIETKSERQTRTERREAIAALGSVLIMRTDLSTLKVMSNSKVLMEESSLSSSRYYRAMADLKKAGFVEITQEKVGSNGNWRTAFVHIKINRAIFSILGMAEWASKQIQRARKIAQETVKNVFKEAADIAKAKAMQKNILSKICNVKTKSKETTDKHRQNERHQYQKALDFVLQGLTLEEIKAKMHT